MIPAVFLDRDGTMLEERGFLTPASTMIVLPWTADAVRLLKRAGFAVVVVTNQSGIARGLYSREFVEETHRALGERLASAGAAVDAWTYCPHYPEARDPALRACDCRKPQAGLAHAAAATLGIDLARSWVVGDQWRDIALAHAIGGRGVLVRSGHGRVQEHTWPGHVRPPDAVCDHLMAAVAYILCRESGT